MIKYTIINIILSYDCDNLSKRIIYFPLTNVKKIVTVVANVFGQPIVFRYDLAPTRADKNASFMYSYKFFKIVKEYNYEANKFTLFQYYLYILKITYNLIVNFY